MRRLWKKIKAVIYRDSRCKLRRKESVHMVAGFVCTCVKLKLCDKDDALKIRSHMDWMHSMNK